MRNEGGGKRDERGQMKDEGRRTSNDFWPGFYFLPCDVPDCARILHSGWGLPKGWTIRVLHLFRTLPKHGEPFRSPEPTKVPSALCIFRALQCHSTSSGLSVQWAHPWAAGTGPSLGMRNDGEKHNVHPLLADLQPLQASQEGKTQHRVPLGLPHAASPDHGHPNTCTRSRLHGTTNPCPRAGLC